MREDFAHRDRCWSRHYRGWLGRLTRLLWRRLDGFRFFVYYLGHLGYGLQYNGSITGVKAMSSVSNVTVINATGCSLVESSEEQRKKMEKREREGLVGPPGLEPGMSEDGEF